MGWWTVQGTEDVVGDDAFTLLRDAAKEVAAAYERELGRCPTRTEWERLVHSALEPLRDLRSPAMCSLFAEDARPLAVQIVLAGADAEPK